MTRMLTLPVFTLQATIAFIFAALLLPNAVMGQKFSTLDDVGLPMQHLASPYKSLIDDTIPATFCKNCDASNCEGSCCNANSPQPDFNSAAPALSVDELESVDACPFCEEVTAREDARDKQCREIAAMLKAALKGKDLSDPDADSAIESALKLAANISQSKSEDKIAQLKARHEREIVVLHERLASLTQKRDTSKEFRTWLGPLYENQNRLSQQLSSLEVQVNKTNVSIDHQLSNNSSPSRNPYNRPEIGQMVPDHALQLFQLQSKLKQLQLDIDHMQRNEAQQANYLRPVFDIDRSLQPIPETDPLRGLQSPNGLRKQTRQR